MSYEPSGFARDIFQKRYAHHDGETFAEACERVARHVAAAENGEAGRWTGAFRELLESNLFMPGGRIWYASGRPKAQLLNCFLAPTGDSREGWGKTAYDMMVVCGTGGGLGINFSPVRPRGSDITGHKGKATGAVSLMQVINAAGEVIKAGGGRRTALMFCLGIAHGDLPEFLDAKLDLGQLNNANVSVWFDEDPEDFFAAVRDGGAHRLIHKGRVVAELPAREVWARLVENSMRGGEPGLLNGYLMNRTNNVWYSHPILGTNPCGELPLSAYDCCCLGALVLPRFVRDDRVDWSALREATKLAHRFLDDVLTVNNYPLPEIKETCATIRRVGLGVMGLHDMLLKLGLSYASAEGLEFVDRVMKEVKHAAYESSVELAREKGPFPAFLPEKVLKSGFCKTLKPSIRAAIREHGLRNAASLTIAPTGTTSIVCDVTSGIEPMFAAAHVRKYRDGDDLRREVVVHPLFAEYVREGRDVSHFQGAYDLALRDHFEMQRTCQRHVDSAVSKTINVMPGTSAEELSELYMEFFPELKGVTVYPEGSREDQPLTPIPLEDALQIARGDEVTTRAYAADACRGGSCDL